MEAMMLFLSTVPSFCSYVAHEARVANSDRGLQRTGCGYDCTEKASTTVVEAEARTATVHPIIS